MPLQMAKQSTRRLPGIARVKNILAVASGKGGVGKSTFSTLLSLALMQEGKKVGLLDADLYGPSLRQMLPEDQMPEENGGLINPGRSHGMSILSLAHFKQENQSMTVRAPIANQLIDQLLHTVFWGDLDWLVIDFPPGTGDIQLSLCQKAPISGAILITTPQQVALLDVRKAIHSFLELNVPILGVVENMSFFKVGDDKQYLFGQGGGVALAKECGVPFFGELPLDPNIANACDLGQPFLLNHPLFASIAKRLNGKKKEVKEIVKLNLSQEQTIEIQWNNGTKREYLAAELQQKCPCIKCLKGASVDPQVKALAVLSVGRYAIRVRFSSGCSLGIYDNETLLD